MTALNTAVEKKQASAEVVKLLLDKNADATTINGVPYSCLLLRLQ
jgi:orotate phosphoribosyltransferase-like protein